MTIIAFVLLLSAAPSSDVRRDATPYRPFDYALMAKISAKNAALRDAAREYDSVTWLPVEQPAPAPKPRYKPRPDREEWARLVALRNQKRRLRATAPVVLFVPPMFRKPCPYMFMSIPAAAWFSSGR